jgi:hypothetical protein
MKSIHPGKRPQLPCEKAGFLFWPETMILSASLSGLAHRKHRDFFGCFLRESFLYHSPEL